MADYPQLPVDSKDHRNLVVTLNTCVRRLNRPTMPVYTVAQLATLPNLERSQVAFATDGRKVGEGGGAGTGVLVFYDGTNWIAVDTGATAAA